MAFAQTVEINEGELAGKSQECQALAAEVERMGGEVTAAPAQDVAAAINEDAVEQCVTFQQQIASSEGDSKSESEAVSEQIDLSEDATIEGQARVTVPEPNVDVQVPPPDVRVTKQQPQVDITREATHTASG